MKLLFGTWHPLYRSEGFVFTALYRAIPEETELRLQKCEQDWDGFWAMLQSAASLQTLHVKIYDRGFRLPEKRYLRPLQSLRLSDFTVQLPWPRTFHPELALDSDEGHPFRIIRPTPEQCCIGHGLFPRKRRDSCRPRKNPVCIVVFVLSLPYIVLVRLPLHLYRRR
ncbi:hypothetical protein BT63DRAFT_58663 [Microthyrium microscopicum]|uniref:Uncharacterized protein n=1 Tax=Microthyrium microscopicum TaxID=703497 RepID=A0A6A6U2B5_9PEZI|nr:hypothetical protein BT63DRAFT_58663 [Microthyrium microscopicum]